jgi:hypothetical protein
MKIRRGQVEGGGGVGMKGRGRGGGVQEIQLSFCNDADNGEKKKTVNAFCIINQKTERTGGCSTPIRLSTKVMFF